MKRIGIIGTGWGRMHVGAFRAAGAEVVVLCGRDAEHTRAIALREQIPVATTDVRALCEQVDVVVVASPDAQHREHVLAALAAGKHVLCEKPLATSLADARELADAAARETALMTAVSFPYRQLPPVLALHRWLSRFEQIEQIDIVLRSGFIASLEGSGDFGGASHPIDAALWLMRTEAEWAQATVRGGALTLLLGCHDGGRINLVHRPTVEPGIHGSWSLCGPGFEAGFFAGYQPSLGGWRISAPRAFIDGAWRDIAPGLEPRPQQREPWAEAHVTSARAFLAGELDGMAGFREAAHVQAVFDAAARSNAFGRREIVTRPAG